jgi:chromosome segregation ATPase
MPESALSRRLPLYAYLEPLLRGRRILEIGRAKDASTDYLVSLGASRVVAAEGDLAGVEASGKDRFDVVLVPEGEAFVRRPEVVASWQKLVADRGRLVVAVANPDRGAGGVGYFDLHDAVARHFLKVQMLGVTPFLGVGLVEFEGAVDGLRIDARLVKEGSEPPAVYVALAGAEPASGLGYALVQLPWSEAPWQSAGAGLGAPDARATVDLKAKLEEATAEAQSAMRVARAQGDEIEELRGRLRRAAEDRAGQDAEIAKLRQGLTQADEAVMSLTRRTTEEMAAVAEKLAAGLRGPTEAEARAAAAELTAARDEADRLRVRLAESDTRAGAAEQRLEELGGEARARRTEVEDALERMRLAESELARARRAATRLEGEARAVSTDTHAAAIAERDRTIALRDERIARLEVEKQDLVWRLAELEDKLRESIARAVRTEAGRGPAAPAVEVGPAAAADLSEAREARERALEGFQRAATAHVDEVNELRASVTEQAALVAELEDAVAAAEARSQSATSEAATLRKTAKDLEEADRSRRTRLAELEGKLLRLEHERKAGGAERPDGDAERRLAEIAAERDSVRRRSDEERAAWNRERDELRGHLDDLGRHLEEAKQAAVGRNGHDAGVAVARELEAIETELQLEAARLDAVAATIAEPEAEGRQPSPPAAGGGAPPPPSDEASSRLENMLGNIRARAARLRDDLEGVRRRLDRLSSTEIAGFLEELGEDLAEIGR